MDIYKYNKKLYRIVTIYKALTLVKRGNVNEDLMGLSPHGPNRYTCAL